MKDGNSMGPTELTSLNYLIIYSHGASVILVFNSPPASYHVIISYKFDEGMHCHGVEHWKDCRQKK